MCPSVENGRLEGPEPENASIVEPKNRVLAAGVMIIGSFAALKILCGFFGLNK
jgi:hypothetical protein